MNKLVCFFALWFVLAVQIFAQTPSTPNTTLRIPFQGKLLQGGKPANGKFNIEFFLPGWFENQQVEIKDGLYAVELGTVRPLPDDIFTKNQILRLDIYVNGTKLEPSINIYPVPFAHKALSVERNSIGGEHIRPGSVQGTHLAKDLVGSFNLQPNAVDNRALQVEAITPDKMKSVLSKSLLFTSTTGEIVWADFTTVATQVFSSVSLAPLPQNHIWVGGLEHRAKVLPIQGDISLDGLGNFRINNGAIDPSKIPNASITSEKIQNLSILPLDLALSNPNHVLTTDQSGYPQWEEKGIFVQTRVGTSPNKVLTTNTLGTVQWEDKSSFVSAYAASGAGINGAVTFWNSVNTQTYDPNLFWDNTNKRLGIGTSNPTVPFEVSSHAKIGGNFAVTGNTILQAGFSVNGTTTLGSNSTSAINMTGSIQGTNALTFEGINVDANKTIFSITEPTAPQTISFPNASGTVALQAAPLTAGSVVFADANGQNSQNNAQLFWDNGNSRLGVGMNAPTEKVEVTGKVKATEFIGFGITPIGGIMMWSGTVAGNFDGTGLGTGNLAGWALCNGNNGTPNLVNRFIVAGGGTYAYASTGGATTHNHTIGGTTQGISSSGVSPGTGAYNVQDDGAGWTTGTHKLDTSALGTVEGNHYHDLGGNAVISTNANLPPYFALAFIMRVQ